MCVDFSASTNGLLKTLKKRYWDIIYDFNRYYPDPDVKIGFIAYGRKAYEEKNKYMKLLSDLTYDYDKIAFELHDLIETVEEGQARHGDAISKAIYDVSWSDDPSVVKMICVVGNGAINRDGLNPFGMIDKLKKENIRLNTYYYKNNDSEAIIKNWRLLAEKGKGAYDEFVLSEPDIHFYKKYDPVWIDDIGKSLSKTYIYYGEKGKENYDNMLYLDSLSRTLGEDCWESRAIFKSSRFYQRRNQDWDLVDLFTTNQIDFSEIDREYLPGFLKSLSDGKLKEYVQLKKIERKELIAELAVQASKRDLFLYRKRTKLGLFSFDKEFSTALILSFNKALAPYFKVSY